MAYFVQNMDFKRLILHFYIFTFLHGGLLRGPQAGLEMTYFVQKLDSTRLILHFYIFTFLHGGLLRGPEVGLEMQNFCLKSKNIEYTP